MKCNATKYPQIKENDGKRKGETLQEITSKISLEQSLVLLKGNIPT